MIYHYYKLLNYILQATETERNCEIMKSICLYLKDKDIKFIMYLYDSFMFDVHKKDIGFLRDIIKIIEMTCIHKIKINYIRNYLIYII